MFKFNRKENKNIFFEVIDIIRFFLISNLSSPRKLIDIKIWLITAFWMWIWVYWVNSDKWIDLAVIAAFYQFSYTFLLWWFFTKLWKELIWWIDFNKYALLISVMIPTLLTISFVSIVHFYEWTPDLLQSVLITAIFTPLWLFFILGIELKKSKLFIGTISEE